MGMLKRSSWRLLCGCGTPWVRTIGRYRSCAIRLSARKKGFNALRKYGKAHYVEKTKINNLDVLKLVYSCVISVFFKIIISND